MKFMVGPFDPSDFFQRNNLASSHISSKLLNDKSPFFLKIWNFFQSSKTFCEFRIAQICCSYTFRIETPECIFGEVFQRTKFSLGKNVGIVIF